MLGSSGTLMKNWGASGFCSTVLVVSFAEAFSGAAAAPFAPDPVRNWYGGGLGMAGGEMFCDTGEATSELPGWLPVVEQAAGRRKNGAEYKKTFPARVHLDKFTSSIHCTGRILIEFLMRGTTKRQEINNRIAVQMQ